MTESIEGGATFAWRLLATLEGGSLLLATSALLIYTARGRVVKRTQRSIISVLVTNTTSTLGKVLKTQLELHGCTVKTLADDMTSKAENKTTSVAEKGTMSVAEKGTMSVVEKGTMRLEGNERVDALVVIGAEVKSDGLDGVAELVTEDVYDNLKLLEAASTSVKPGGRIAWACAGAGETRGSFSVAETAFDAVLQAMLQNVAAVTLCEPIWVGRCFDTERAAERVVAALLKCTTPHHTSFSLRNAATKASNVVCRWLKIIT